MGSKNNRNSAFTLASGSRKGFTLVELIIVIAIIAILTTIAIAYLRGQLFKGNDARRKADMNRIGIASEEYEKDHNCYPSATIVVCESGGAGLQPYLDKIPCDPITNKSYAYEPGPGSCPAWYRVYTKLQNTADPVVFGSIEFSGNSYNYYLGSANAPVISRGNASPPASSSAPGSGGATTGYWGCISGSCVPIQVSSPGNPVCGPSYQTADCPNSSSIQGQICDAAHECR